MTIPTAGLPPAAQDAFERARDAFDAAQFDRAAVELERAWARAPGAPALLILRGDLAYERGDFAAAQADYEAAVAAAPDSYDAHYNLALALAAQGEHDAAIEHFTIAIELDNQAPEPFADRAASELALDLPVNALLDYDEALELDENFYEAALGRGRVRLRLRQLGEAIADLAHAVDLAPEEPEPYLALAEAAMAVGDPQLAFNTLGEGLEQVGDASVRPHLHRARTEALMALNRFDEALADWTAAITGGLAGPDAYVARGEAHLEQGDLTAALADFETALTLEPGNIEALSARAEVLAESGERERALAAYDALLAAHPTAAGHNARGDLYFEMGRADDARADYEAAIALEPNFSPAWHNLGLILSEQGSRREACRAFDHAIEADPREPEFFRSRAELFAAADRPFHAWLDWNRVLELDESYIEAYLGRGVAAQALGGEQPALDDFSTALELDPAYGAARAARAQLLAELGNERAAAGDWAAYLELPDEEQDPELLVLARRALDA